ncbi:MAG: response regulator [Nitrosomonadales bacterium]|nr:response regulator [Nitrosomonadales bacterium]
MKILVVDDDELMRDWVGAVLADMGYEVITAADGRAAVSCFEQQSPNLILLDQVMPGMNGFEVARAIRAKNSWVPIIFVSAYSGNEEVLEGLQAGGDDYLFKPVDYQILGAKLRVYQDRLRMSQTLREQNGLLLDYREQIREEQDLARDFINQFIALDKISDPQVRFLLKPADNFSGDLVAVARTPDNRLHVLLADSAGHGLTSALAVIPITQPFYQMTAKGFDVPSIVKEINRSVRAYLPLPRYVAATVISIDQSQQIIQVWNGGCPDALFFRTGMGVQRFKSQHLPLGVLSVAEFDAAVEYYGYAQQSGCLVLCSDGATELLVNGEIGQELADVIAALPHASAQQLMDNLDGIYRQVLDGGSPPDDIALMAVDCRPVDDAALPVAGQRSSSRLAGIEPGQCDIVWQFSSTMSAPQLRQLDVIPFLLNVAGQVDEAMTDGRVFLVLSELFNNALDHGLLKLDSALKNQIDGMDHYFRMRAERLNALEQGQISVCLAKQFCPGGTRLQVSVKDSGDGFDHAAMRRSEIGVNLQKSGRGIALLDSLCSELRYSGNGSEVYASLDLLPE